MTNDKLELPLSDLLDKAIQAGMDRKAEIVAGYLESIELPLENIVLVFEEAYQTDDRSCAILIFSLLDNLMMSLMSQSFSGGNKKMKKEIFDNRGILSTASSRITMCFMLGWIDYPTYHSLNLIRDIRNEFAHNVLVKSFSDKKIAGKLTSFLIGYRDVVTGTIAKLDQNVVSSATTEFDRKEKFYFCVCMTFLLKEMCLSLASVPFSHRFGVDQERVYNYSTVKDTKLYSISLAFTKAFVTLMRELTGELVVGDE